MVESKSSSSTEILSTAQKRNGFHAKYLAVCKSKNLMPLPEVKVKQRNIHFLDFHADRVKPFDWIAICSSLYNDKTLKSVTIRLRKNSERVFEQLDTLKKAQSLANAPVIYSKFLFNELVKSLQNLTMNSNILENLVLEGFPLSGRYMTTFASGLTQNQTIKSLSFTRCNIGDEACETLCETLKHLTNVETLNLSGCNLGLKGIEMVTNLVKFHKIQRFSEAWSQSLRYQNVNADSFPGLRSILLNNNPDIGDKGVEIFAEALKEDVWVKDIEMQRCGLTDEGAQHIINCLSFNRTILNFNISGNPEVSEHLYRHIVVHLGHADLDSSDSNDSKSSTKKLTKFELMDKVKFLEEQIEMEIFRRKKMEELQDKLQQQIVDFQKEMAFQGSFKIPDGFTLVANATMENLLKENSELVQTSSARLMKPRRKRRILTPKKAISFTTSRPPTTRFQHVTTSETLIKPGEQKKNIFIERNIGDHAEVSDDSSVSGSDLLRSFARKKHENQPNVDQAGDHLSAELRKNSAEILQVFSKQNSGNFQHYTGDENQCVEITDEGEDTANELTLNPCEKLQFENNSLPMFFDPRNLFSNSPKCVPQNSDAESDD